MKPVVFFGYFLTLDEFHALPKDRQDAVEDEFITGSTGLEVILNPDSVAFGLRMIDGAKMSGDFAELDVNLSRKIRMPIFIQKLETSMNRIFYGGKPMARPPRIGLLLEQDVHKMSESVTVACEECGTEFEAGKRNARYCPKCGSDRRIEQNFQAAQRHQKDESRRIGSEEVCECGKTYTVTSGRNRKCPKCRAKDRAQYVRDFQRKKPEGAE